MAPTSSNGSSGGRAVAYAGSPPGKVPVQDVFTFIFSQPFQSPNEYTPASQVVPPIEPDRPIYVDNETGAYTHRRGRELRERARR